MRKEKLILCFTKMLKHWEKIYEKTVIRVKKIQCNVTSRMSYLEFAFKGLKYARNIAFLLIFWLNFSNVTKTEWFFFLH